MISSLLEEAPSAGKPASPEPACAPPPRLGLAPGPTKGTDGEASDEDDVFLFPATLAQRRFLAAGPTGRGRQPRLERAAGVATARDTGPRGAGAHFQRNPAAARIAAHDLSLRAGPAFASNRPGDDDDGAAGGRAGFPGGGARASARPPPDGGNEPTVRPGARAGATRAAGADRAGPSPAAFSGAPHRVGRLEQRRARP